MGPTPPTARTTLAQCGMKCHMHAARKAAAFLATPLILGAAMTFAICAMAAWDLSVAPLAANFNVFGGGNCGFTEPALLRLWRRFVAYERPDIPYEQPRLRPPDGESADEEGASVGAFTVGESWWYYQLSRGFYDRVSVTTLTPVVPDSGQDEPSFDAFRRWSQWQSLVPPGATESSFAAAVATVEEIGDQAFGMMPERWSPSILWSCGSAQPHGASVSRLPTTTPDLEPDSVIWTAARTGHIGRRECETRVYGWPLRCLWVQGVREQEWQIAWVVYEDGKGGWEFIRAVRDEHWTNALADFSGHWSWSCDSELAPASGIPWRPLWIPLLANSLALGLPLTLFGVGVSRATTWGWRRLIGRGRRRCSNCGYSRTGIASGTRCPECGAPGVCD